MNFGGDPTLPSPELTEFELELLDSVRTAPADAAVVHGRVCCLLAGGCGAFVQIVHDLTKFGRLRKRADGALEVVG